MTNFVRLYFIFLILISFQSFAKEDIKNSSEIFPKWMVRVESTYSYLDNSRNNKVARIRGVGFIVHVPAKVEPKMDEHFIVITDAHLSQGNAGTNLSIFRENKWINLNIKSNSSGQLRYSKNLFDIEIIEVEKIAELIPDDLFIFEYRVGKDELGNDIDDSYFSFNDNTHYKNELLVGTNSFVVIPPDLDTLSTISINLEQYNSKFLNHPTNLLNQLRRENEEKYILGISMTNFGKEIQSHSHIIGGMSGSPLLVRKEGRLKVKGLSKRYHRYFQKSYFTPVSELSSAFLDFAEKFYFGGDLPNNKFMWSFLPDLGTYLKSDIYKISENPTEKFNSGTIELMNSAGGNHDTADAGGGNHDTADAGEPNGKVNPISIDLQPLKIKDKEIYGFSIANANQSLSQLPAQFNISASLDSFSFASTILNLSEDIKLEYLYKSDLFKLLKTRFANLKTQDEVNKILKENIERAEKNTSSADLRTLNLLKNHSIPGCYIKSSSIPNFEDFNSIEELPNIEIAIINPAHFTEDNIYNSFYRYKIPLRPQLIKYSNLSLDTKGLFFINANDLDCPVLNCSTITIFHAIPYLIHQWKDEQESSINQCVKVDNDDEFNKFKIPAND